jgi:hypothetical protein
MNCNEIRELLPDVAAGGQADAAVTRHITSCAACATHLSDLQKTMALLEEWRAPEPSPYFDTRLQARLREEMARPAAGWLSGLNLSNWNWLLRPAWAMSLAAALLAGAVTIGVNNKSYFVETDKIATNPPALSLPVQPGTAVGDLQALERNDELYADFDMLDDLQVQDDVTANP